MIDIYTRPAELLQTLIRFDTSNPPGNEAECISYIDGLLQAAGIETTRLAKDLNRPNLLARIKGTGSAPSLLLQGHVDVVPTSGQQWAHPPFAGLEVDGYIWGRGALDMKSGVSMMLSAFLRIAAEGTPPNGDVMLCILSDEEAGGVYGARFLVEEHPEQFEGIRYSIGEFGGFSMLVDGRTFYPIQVAEKLQCTLRFIVRGPGGHGSMPIAGGAMARLGKLLNDLDRKRTPIHITPVMEMMVGGMADATRPPTSTMLRQLLNPQLTDQLLASSGDRLRRLTPLVRNTISPTMVGGGHKINVIPSEITLDADGRMLPGFGPEEMMAEIRALVGDEVEIEVLHHDVPAASPPDLSHFQFLGDVIRELDPEGIAVPYLAPGVTDARFFRQLGIQNYGFTPMKLPPDFNFGATVHAADERIPVAAVEFGAQAMYTAVRRWGKS